MDLAAVFAARARPVRAARLMGATAALCDLLGIALAAVNQHEYARTEAIVREQLRAPTFDQAWSAGRALTLEQALVEAAAPLAPVTLPGTLPVPLTRREAEVVRLLAHGYADR